MTTPGRPRPDDAFDRVVRDAIHRHEPAGVCPDPSELAALVEGTLSTGERRVVEAHAASCARCSAELAVLARLPADEAAPAAARPARLWHLRWAVPLASAVVVFAVWSETRDRTPEQQAAPAVVRGPQAPGAGSARQSPADADALRETLTETLEAVPEALPETAPGSRPEPTSPKPAPGSRVAESRSTRSAPPAEADLPDLNEPPPAPPAAAAPLPPAAPGAGPAAAPAAPPGTEAQRQAARDAAAELRRSRESIQPAAEPKRDESGAVGGAQAETVQLADDDDTAPLRKSEGTRAAAKFAGQAVPFTIRLGEVQVRVRGRTIERTTDAGATWKAERQDLEAMVLAGACPTAEVCWLVGDRGLILRREPSGRWIELPAPAPVALIGVQTRDAHHATVTAEGGARFATADGGRTWSPVP